MFNSYAQKFYCKTLLLNYNAILPVSQCVDRLSHLKTVSKQLIMANLINQRTDLIYYAFEIFYRAKKKLDCIILLSYMQETTYCNAYHRKKTYL